MYICEESQRDQVSTSAANQMSYEAFYLHQREDCQETSHNPDINPREDIADGIRRVGKRSGAIIG